MKGERVANTEPNRLLPGQYARWGQDGNMYARPPGSKTGFIANLGRHTITEHEDGTITVSPSILVSGHEMGDDGKRKAVSWHGYLERGIWKEC